MKSNARVLITGSNGHVGFNLAKTLNEQGYTVRATVRDSDNANKTTALSAAGIDDIVSLNIRDPDRFTEISTGIDYLFHVAATYRHYTGSDKADRELIKDSTEGVRSAMTAAARNKIGKVILTSSAVTLPFAKIGQPIPDHTQWDPNPALVYRRAKIAGEKLAWEMAKTQNINLATILPCGIIGPNFGKGTQSTDMILSMMMGSMRLGTLDRIFAFVDVRDVVSAHILAAQKDAKGRFVVNATKPATMVEAFEIMHRIDPRVPRPLMIVPEFAYGGLPFFDWAMSKTMGTPRSVTREFIAGFKTGNMLASNQSTKEILGWNDQISLESSLRDTMEELCHKGAFGQRTAK